MFSIRDLRLYFLALEPWVARSALIPRCSSGLSMHECGAAGLPATTLLRLLATQLPVSALPTVLDKCFFFNSFCQFWLFFVFKLLLSFFWLWEEAQCVYLHLHLGRNSITTLLNSVFDRSLASILFVYSSGKFSCVVFGAYFFVSPVWLPLCICYCVFGRSFMFFTVGIWPYIVCVFWRLVAQSP